MTRYAAAELLLALAGCGSSASPRELRYDTCIERGDEPEACIRAVDELYSATPVNKGAPKG